MEKEWGKMDKEWEKLMELEFEYNIARLSGQEEEIVKKAKAKYTRQLNKVKKLQETSSNEQKDKNSINILED